MPRGAKGFAGARETSEVEVGGPALACLLLRGFAEIFARLFHGGLEILAGLLPSLVFERDGALAHALALVLAGLFAAAAFSRTVVVPLAGVFLNRGTVGLDRTVVF